jgi:hypothetical protein
MVIIRSKIRNGVAIIGVAGAIVFGAQRLGAGEQVGVLVIDDIKWSEAEYIRIHSEKDKFSGKTNFCVISEDTSLALKRSLDGTCKMLIVPRGIDPDTAVASWLSQNGEARAYVKTIIK